MSKAEEGDEKGGNVWSCDSRISIARMPRKRADRLWLRRLLELKDDKHLGPMTWGFGNQIEPLLGMPESRLHLVSLRVMTLAAKGHHPIAKVAVHVASSGGLTARPLHEKRQSVNMVTMTAAYLDEVISAH